jgi:hypothetical protein
VPCHPFVAVVLEKPRPLMGQLIGHTNTEYSTQNPVWGTNANIKVRPPIDLHANRTSLLVKGFFWLKTFLSKSYDKSYRGVEGDGPVLVRSMQACQHNRPRETFSVCGSTRLAKASPDAGPCFLFYAKEVMKDFDTPTRPVTFTYILYQSAPSRGWAGMTATDGSLSTWSLAGRGSWARRASASRCTRRPSRSRCVVWQTSP